MVELIDFHDPGKFWKPPDAEFQDILVSMGLKEIKGKQEFYLNFGVDQNDDGDELEKDMVFYGYSKAKEDGKISDFFAFGKMVRSIRSLGVKINDENGVITTTPNITGKKVTMNFDPKTDRKVTGTTESGESKISTFHNWEMTEVAGITKGSGGATATPAPKKDPALMVEPWKEFLIENLSTPTNENGIIKLCTQKLPDAATRKPYSDTRKATLGLLVKEGFLSIDEDGKYAVV